MAAAGAAGALGAVVLSFLKRGREQESSVVSDMDKVNSGWERHVAALQADLESCRTERLRLEARERALVTQLREAGVDAQ